MNDEQAVQLLRILANIARALEGLLELAESVAQSDGEG